MSGEQGAIPAYGAVLVDFDDETLMSLGVMDDTAHLQAVILVEAPPSVWGFGEVRPIPIDLIGMQATYGTRYAVQEDPS